LTERRRQPRAPLNPVVQIRFKNLDEFLTASAVNVSQGGMFLAATEPCEVGTVLDLQFLLVDGEPLVEVQARVVWVRSVEEATPEQPAGYGVTFLDLDAVNEALLERVVRNYLKTP
jgi:uncharacterized protein (TIGR02266 family)